MFGSDQCLSMHSTRHCDGPWQANLLQSTQFLAAVRIGKYMFKKSDDQQMIKESKLMF